MITPLAEPTPALLARLDAALRARDRLRRQPLAARARALAAAAARWRADAALAAALPEPTRLSPPMIDAAMAFAAEALEVDALVDLAGRECGTAALDRPPGEGPALVAHVLASNVPALAVPAIALGCLAGAAVLVKSGRDDPLSAPAFAGALAAVDPELAATVVTAYWPGGDVEREQTLLARADVVVLTGGDAALAALAPRVRGRLVAHGPRASVAAVARAALDDPTLPDGLALDVAMHDQRGCLSPHAVYVEAGGDAAAELAARLAAALDRVAVRLPPGSASLAERAARRQRLAETEWDGASRVLAGAGGTVVCDARPAFRPTWGGRTVRVHPLAALADLPAHLPSQAIECVGVAGADPADLAPALRERGVSRLCPPGRMQRPPLSWPRGQMAPLRSLLGHATRRLLEVER